MLNITDELLHRDTIAETEKMLNGKDYHEFNDFENMIMLVNAMEDNKIKNNHLNSLGDTHFGMKWNDFIKLIESYGFIKGLRYSFVPPKYYDDEEERAENAIIYYHPTKGLVLWATSYGKSINGGKVYGEVLMNKEIRKDIYKALHDCSHGAFATWNRDKEEDEYKEQIEFDYDIREGLIHVLTRIENTTKFASIWKDSHFLWFVDYAEEKQEGYDYKKITEEKILKCPIELQNIITTK